MTTIAIIPARGGSKSIPLKNLRNVGGLSLLERTIVHAKESSVDRIVVTSDHHHMLKMARECHVETIERPAELATDEAHGDDVFVHALATLGFSAESPKTDLAVFLQPTSPLRPAGLIDECLSTLVLGGLDSVFTAHEGHFAWRIIDGKVTSVQGPNARQPRQKIPPEDKLYIENGCVYVCRIPTLFQDHNRLCGRIGIVRMDALDAIDIDSEWDLWLAEQRTRYKRIEALKNTDSVGAHDDPRMASWQ